MTPLNSNWQTSNWQNRNGVTAIEGSRAPQFVDYTVIEETYELLPSGD